MITVRAHFFAMKFIKPLSFFNNISAPRTSVRIVFQIHLLSPFRDKYTIATVNCQLYRNFVLNESKKNFFKYVLTNDII